MLLNCGVGEDSWESLGLQGNPTSPFWRRSALGFLWREWWWSWKSSTLATSCEELTHWTRLWCWEELGAGGEGDDRGWDGGMASPTHWTWVWVNSRSWWWTGRPGCCDSWGRKELDTTERLNWTELKATGTSFTRPWRADFLENTLNHSGGHHFFLLLNAIKTNILSELPEVWNILPWKANIFELFICHSLLWLVHLIVICILV